MKIRSITCFADPGRSLDPSQLELLGGLAAALAAALKEAGYEVQTRRLATTPLAALLPELSAGRAVELATDLEALAKRVGFEYLALGPALPAVPASFDLVLPVLGATQAVFLSGMMTLPGGVSLTAVRRCAEIIAEAAKVTPDGFTNLRFAALANVPAGTPFFPAAYHQGQEAVFALATEAADLAVEALEIAGSLPDAASRLAGRVEAHAASLTRLADEVGGEWGVPFSGIDFTLAPFPEERRSIGAAIEKLGVPAVGLHGSLAAVAFLTGALERVNFRRAGFSGLMLPVLEDFSLARRAAEGRLTVKDLLLYAAVCGTGLDTIPLPGDVRLDQLYPVLLDLAALSQRLDKPLTARLMPIPGKQAGDSTGFDFAYFAASAVLALDAEPVSGLLGGEGTLDLFSRPG